MFFYPLAGLVFSFFFLSGSVAGLHNVTIQENDPRIRYSGGVWAHVLDLSDKPSLLGCSNGLMENAVEGSFFEFNFTGTAVYLNTINGAKGTFKAILDGKPFDFDSDNATTAHCRVAYAQTGLEDVQHRLVVLNAGSPSSLLFDSITYTESDPYDYGRPPAGSIPQSDAVFEYVPIRPQAARVTPSGSWEAMDLAPVGDRIGFCADVVFQTTTIGSSLELRFNGTGIQVNTYADRHSRGLITFSIDGQNEVVDGRGSVEGCTLSWFRKDMSPDIEHVLRVINTAPADPQETSLLSVVSIRYITRADDPSFHDPNNLVPGLRALPAFVPYESTPTNPVVIGGAVAAGILVLSFLAFIFYWARRDRLKQAARKLDEEKAMSHRKWDDRKKTEVLLDEHRAPRRPKQNDFDSVSLSFADDVPRKSTTTSDSDSRSSSQQSGRRVLFLEPPDPSRS